MLGLQIQRISLVFLAYDHEMTVVQAHVANENPLDAMLQEWIYPSRENRLLPESLSSSNIPSLNICVRAFVVRHNVSDALISNWFDLWRGPSLGKCKRRKHQHARENCCGQNAHGVWSVLTTQYRSSEVIRWLQRSLRTALLQQIAKLS